MGLTERHWFENEDVPENYEWALEGAVYGSRIDKKANMVEVVRCKDCVNCIKETNGELFCDILAIGYEPLGSKKVNENWFCADGEREEKE